MTPSTDQQPASMGEQKAPMRTNETLTGLLRQAADRVGAPTTLFETEKLRLRLATEAIGLEMRRANIYAADDMLCVLERLNSHAPITLAHDAFATILIDGKMLDQMREALGRAKWEGVTE